MDEFPDEETVATEETTAEPQPELSLEDELFAALIEGGDPTDVEPEPEAIPDGEPEPEPAEAETDGDETEDEPEEETDEDSTDEPLANDPPSANKRIRQLVAQRKAKEAEVTELQQRLADAEKRSATATPEHPDPENELAELQDEYSRVKTPQAVIESGAINPLTGEPYSAAEAQAAVAELKQDLMYKMRGAEGAVVSRMEQSRTAERLSENMRVPLAELITKYPQLDQTSATADKDLCATLQAVIDSNTVLDGGLLSGFKTEPDKFVKQFERVLVKLGTVKANGSAIVDAKKDKVPAKGALSNRTAKTDDVDDFMEYFDKAMKNL